MSGSSDFVLIFYVKIAVIIEISTWIRDTYSKSFQYRECKHIIMWFHNSAAAALFQSLLSLKMVLVCESQYVRPFYLQSLEEGKKTQQHVENMVYITSEQKPTIKINVLNFLSWWCENIYVAYNNRLVLIFKGLVLTCDFGV